MVPKLPWVHAPVVALNDPHTELGARKLVWFSTLKTSARNCRRACSQGSEKFFTAARSSCQNGALRTMFRPALPNGWLGSVGTWLLPGLHELRYWPREGV